MKKCMILDHNTFCLEGPARIWSMSPGSTLWGKIPIIQIKPPIFKQLPRPDDRAASTNDSPASNHVTENSGFSHGIDPQLASVLLTWAGLPGLLFSSSISISSSTASVVLLLPMQQPHHLLG